MLRRIVQLFRGEISFVLVIFLFLIFVVVVPLATSVGFLRPAHTATTTVEPWTGVEALHWSVITFTTVGLGDYTTMALCGFIRKMGEADGFLDRLWTKCYEDNKGEI